MRSLLSRCATVAFGAVLAAVALPAAPASAATSATCPAASSTRVFPGDIAGYPNNKVWVYSPSSTTTVICFYFSVHSGLDRIGGGAIVVNAPASVSQVPSVTPGSEPTLCANNLLNIADPVAFRIAYSGDLASYCFTAAGETVTVTLGLPSASTEPSVELWHDGANPGATTTWDMLLCSDEWTLEWVDLSSSYDECAQSNGSVVLDPAEEAEDVGNQVNQIVNDPVGEVMDLVEAVERLIS